MIVDLRKTKEEMKPKNKGDDCCVYDEDVEIPYNLRFSLEDREVEKLNISTRKFEVDQEIEAVVKLRVQGLNSSANSKGKHETISFGIIGLGLPEEDVDAAEVMYGDS